MLYMSWDYEFKYRLLFWCISLCGMVLYPVAKWYIEDTALKFTRPDFWNSGFFADTPEKKWDCLRFIRVLFSYYLFR
ncbi:colicin E1 family microcin immunity protein [Escherichia coli]|uniref:colicin E1 family microcin immunity protein n=1 Tax=Escherichia coli TaxID=562 RepID=UPI0040692020